MLDDFGRRKITRRLLSLLVARQGDVSRKLNQAFLLVDSFNFNFVDDERSNIYIGTINRLTSKVSITEWLKIEKRVVSRRQYVNLASMKASSALRI